MPEDMTEDSLDDLVSVKVHKFAHMLLKFLPTMGIQMQHYASHVIVEEFRKDFPELYNFALGRLELSARNHIDSYLESLARESETSGASAIPDALPSATASRSARSGKARKGKS